MKVECLDGYPNFILLTHLWPTILLLEDSKTLRLKMLKKKGKTLKWAAVFHRDTGLRFERTQLQLHLPLKQTSKSFLIKTINLRLRGPQQC